MPRGINKYDVSMDLEIWIDNYAMAMSIMNDSEFGGHVLPAADARGLNSLVAQQPP